MAEKMTTMVLNTVDLQCSSCYKKVKKVLCKFPQIRDQVYDAKNSKVTIKVLCCNPEKIRDELCCKGSKVIKSIQILDDPPKTKAPEKPKEAPQKPKEAPTEKPKEAPEKPKEASEKPKEEEKAEPPAEKPMPMYPYGTCCESCSQGYDGGPCYQGYGRPVPPPPGEKPMPMYPRGTCCESCSQGYGGGPCYQGYGRPVPPPPGEKPMSMYPRGTCCESCSQGYGGGPCYQGYGRPVPPPPGPCYDYLRPAPAPGPCYDYGYGYRGSKCCVSTDYLSEENPQGCTIM